MKAPDRLKESARHADPSAVGARLSRRRLAVLLAVGTATLAIVSGCGEEEKRKPGGYSFPGAEKDGAGRFKSSQTL